MKMSPSGLQDFSSYLPYVPIWLGQKIIEKNLLNLTLKSDIYEYFRFKFLYLRGCPDFWSFQYGRYVS